MLRIPARLIVAGLFTLSVFGGAWPAQAAPPSALGPDDTDGWLCTVLEIDCP